jgi:hypothetical protein
MGLDLAAPHTQTVRSRFFCITFREFCALAGGMLLGCLFIHFVPRESDRHSKSEVIPAAHTSPLSLPVPPPGWKYTATYSGAFKDHRLTSKHWASQCGQDRTVRDVFKGKRGGYFIELASNEAFYISNTLTLEQEFGWHGLCVEANEKYAYDYRGRSCLLVQAVVGTQNDNEVVFDMVGSGGGIVGFDRREGDAASAGDGRVTRRTVSLLSMLTAFGAPRIIDYFSLDIEGAEYSVLKEFDFSAFTFLTMSIERPVQELKDLLAANGYTYLCSHGPAGDEFYFHESLLLTPGAESLLHQAVLSGVIGEGKAPPDWGPPSGWTGIPFRAGAPCKNGMPPWN